MKYKNIAIKRRLNESHDPKASVDDYGKATYDINVNAKFSVKVLDRPSWNWIEHRVKAGLHEAFHNAFEYAEVEVIGVKPGTTVSFSKDYDLLRGARRGKWRKYR
jgi:hypothetical protein